MKQIIVIGGGAAGMMAAITAAQQGADVLLLEKNEKLGRKIYITGKGRCNVTNACEMERLLKNVVTNPRFLYSAFYSFSNEDTMRFFEECGVPLKIERGERVFPVSDKSSDIIDGLARRLKQTGVKVRFGATVNKVCTEDGRVSAVVGTHTHVQTADERILPKGTAYMTDAGMCGGKNSVLGVKKELIIGRFINHLPVRHEYDPQDIELCGCLIEIDEKTGKATNIQRIRQ